jgi:protein-S-isoprenylcysteine O-methyltransferase Ste14
MVVTLLTVLAAAANLLNAGGAVASARASVRIWPPGDRDWRYWFMWACWSPATLGLVAVGVLDRGSLGSPLPVRVAGAGVTVVGVWLALSAARELGVTRTTGLGGTLRTGGWYRYSRNPQYVGTMVATVGWLLATDSRLAALVGGTSVLYHLSLPFAEEPWLRDRHGAAYRRYADRVPRFVGRGTLARLLGRAE